MASPSLSPAQCAMFACPHAGEPLERLTRADNCAHNCAAPLCEGCVRDIVRSVGHFKCPFCSRISSSISTTREVTVKDLLKDDYHQFRRALKRARASGERGDDGEWEVDAIVGVQSFGGDIHYKVMWSVQLDKRSFDWIEVEQQCSWEPRDELVKNSALLLNGFHKTFSIPFPLPADYDFSFAAPSVRIDPITKTPQYRCAHLDCASQSAKKSTAMKHAYSSKHRKADGNRPTTASPFTCSLCSNPSKGFAQKCSLQKHRKDFHIAKIDEEIWKAYGLQLREEQADTAMIME